MDDAVRYYEAQQLGLGMEFAGEVYASIARIGSYPFAWTPISPNTHRCLLNRFPFGVIFRVNADMLEVIAVAHLQRRPDYWKGRV